MFNRKHRKVRYAKCPYCGKSPVISEGRSITDKNELVMHYKCPKNHLTTGDTPYPNRALELWLLAVGKVLKVDDAQALLRQLEMLLPERPSRDEPEEPGFYRTRTGAFLRKNENGAWSALFINGDLIPRYWNDQDDYAKWRTVLDCLYPRAFPLTPTTAPYPLKGE